MTYRRGALISRVAVTKTQPKRQSFLPRKYLMTTFLAKGTLFLNLGVLPMWSKYSHVIREETNMRLRSLLGANRTVYALLKT